MIKKRIIFLHQQLLVMLQVALEQVLEDIPLEKAADA